MATAIQRQVLDAIVTSVEGLSIPTVDSNDVREMSRIDYEHKGIAVIPGEEIVEGATMERDDVAYPVSIVLLQGASGYDETITDVATFRQTIRRTFHNKMLTLGSLPAGACHEVCQVRSGDYVVPKKLENNINVSSMLVLAWFREARTLDVP